MSNKNQFIIITPPLFLNEDRMEFLNSPGHKCSYCHGHGWFWGVEGLETVKVDCPVCEGSGRLNAAITIEWKPAKSE